MRINDVLTEDQVDEISLAGVKQAGLQGAAMGGNIVKGLGKGIGALAGGVVGAGKAMALSLIHI